MPDHDGSALACVPSIGLTRRVTGKRRSSPEKGGYDRRGPGRPGAGRPQSSSSRIVASALRIRRETCIWESPTRSAIWVCGSSSSKRIRRDLALARGQVRQNRSQGGALFGALEASSSSPIDSSGSPSSSLPAGTESDSVV